MRRSTMPGYEALDASIVSTVVPKGMPQRE